MSISKSDNAIMAKAHALYGKRLNTEAYEQLLQKRTVSEITGFLKNETYYSETLSEIKEELVHREQLELMLSRRELDIYVKLNKYSYGEDIFLTMYKMKNEIEQLIFAMRLLNAGDMNKFIVSFPVFLTKHLAFDLFEVAKIKDYDDLLTVLKRTDYYGIIGKFRPTTSDKPIDIPACEQAMLTYYYTKLLNIVDNDYSGETREYLKRILYYMIDFHNISAIFRMKRYFNATRQAIESCMLPIKAKLSQAAYEELLDVEDTNEIGEVLKRYKASYAFTDDTSLSAERITINTEKNKMQMGRRIFRFSSIPVVVVISYMMMLEIEMYNLINIIEGARYQVSPEEIRSMLVM